MKLYNKIFLYFAPCEKKINKRNFMRDEKRKVAHERFKGIIYENHKKIYGKTN